MIKSILLLIGSIAISSLLGIVEQSQNISNTYKGISYFWIFIYFWIFLCSFTLFLFALLNFISSVEQLITKATAEKEKEVRKKEKLERKEIMEKTIIRN